MKVQTMTGGVAVKNYIDVGDTLGKPCHPLYHKYNQIKLLRLLDIYLVPYNDQGENAVKEKNKLGLYIEAV